MNIKTDATNRGVEIEVSDAVLLNLIHGDCVYCGASATPLNGVDRVDNTLGYVAGNIVSACKMCNIAKNNHSVDEFLSWIERVHRRQVKIA